MAPLVHGYHGEDDADKLRGQAEKYYTRVINAYYVSDTCTYTCACITTLYCILTKGSSLGCLGFKEEIYMCKRLHTNPLKHL